MPKAPPPRRATVDGEEFILLSPEEYERLDASRRQVGAALARVRQVSHALGTARAALTAVDTALAAEPCTCADTGTCPVCRIRAARDTDP
ncbi:hypothetical protein Cs7R123_13410 [Catellatospora sp. TT07R-123]|uniref:hypothetical protein n=1 Tax=Catellatospora sp. TT07R-123 TaxID=2733863 RepID=UPI001B0CB5AB|nr:hypothetical protein [Catellatospora sp. TT07R-123]GHJ43999.1 hypothetical protein Cs7R123_13410 [Catellatospora sp. TT07R-123]